MGNATDLGVIRLERRYGGSWQIWLVHRAYGGPVWCARRWDDEKKIINAGSEEELADLLEQGGFR